MNLIDNHQRRISSSYYTSSTRFRYDSIYPIFSSQDKMNNYRPVSMDDDSSESNSSSTNELAGESTPLLSQLPCECLSHHDRIRLLLSYLPLPPVATSLIWKLARLPDNVLQVLKDTRRLLLALKAWAYANPKQFTMICIGVILFALACASPAILAAMGFSAVGPVAGGFAAGWQAAIGGSVAAGSLFAFLQSAAMGGAAIGLFTGIGAVGVLFTFVGAVGWQAGIGSVAAGRLFAFLQSAAMGGATIGRFTGIRAVGVLFAVRKKVAETGEIISENSGKAGEAIKDGAIQVGGAVAVGAIQMGKTVGGWWGKMKGKMKGE